VVLRVHAPEWTEPEGVERRRRRDGQRHGQELVERVRLELVGHGLGGLEERAQPGEGVFEEREFELVAEARARVEEQPGQLDVRGVELEEVPVVELVEPEQVHGLRAPYPEGARAAHRVRAAQIQALELVPDDAVRGARTFGGAPARRQSGDRDRHPKRARQRRRELGHGPRYHAPRGSLQVAGGLASMQPRTHGTRRTDDDPATVAPRTAAQHLRSARGWVSPTVQGDALAAELLDPDAKQHPSRKRVARLQSTARA
jgi:hypothetical protein